MSTQKSTWRYYFLCLSLWQFYILWWTIFKSLAKTDNLSINLSRLYRRLVLLVPIMSDDKLSFTNRFFYHYPSGNLIIYLLHINAQPSYINTKTKYQIKFIKFTLSQLLVRNLRQFTLLLRKWKCCCIPTTF